MADDLVLTPGGFRPKSVVHMVEAGHVLHVTEAGILQKRSITGEVVKEYGAAPVRPGNEPLHPANVYVPADVAPGLASGWITYTSWTNNTGKPVKSFKTTWMVPPAPSTQSGQVIFLFNGIQNSSFIYQPVLQWGVSAAGGGNYWAVASWYVDGQGGAAFHSQLTKVNPGQTLTGIMTLTGQSGSNFSYNCDFVGIPNSGYAVQNIQQLTWCIETLEAYGVTKCTDYPAIPMTAMAGIEITTTGGEAPIVWQANNPVTDCGQHSVVVTNASPNGEVVLYYRAGSEQNTWRWCHKCQGFFFAGNASKGVCPADHKAHDPSQSGLYAALFGETSPGAQGVWRWCHKCQGMFFSGNATQGVCPAGGAHDPSQSGHYATLFGESGVVQQGVWRWCHKCQGMFFSGNPTQGVCPAGGAHDGSQSGHYAEIFSPIP